jgi:VWFA-related protein
MSKFQPVFRTLALASCVAFAHAQSPSEPSRLQRLDIVAVDNSGQPATGLTAADFQVTDQGKTQKIVVFHGPSAPAPAGTFSNRGAAGAHATAILFDFMNANRQERNDASHHLANAIKQLESGENLYLYMIGPDGAFDAVHEIPKDPSAPGDKGWTKDIDKLMTAAVKSHDKTVSGISDEDVVKKTYVAMETVGNQLSIFPGRHDIILVTGWVKDVSNPKSTCSGDWIDCSLYVPHLAVTLDHAGTMVDPIYYGTANVDQGRRLDDMASLTGGKAYIGQEVNEVMKQWATQAPGAYSLGYDTAASNWDSKFHKVKVTCSRPGVKVQFKQRYYAVPDQRPMPQRQQAMMVGAYQSAGDVDQVGMRATVAKGSAPNTVKVDLRLAASDLVLHDSGGQMAGTITLLYSTRTNAGPQGEPTLGDMEVKVSKDQMADGILISKEFPIDGATTKSRLIVLDKSTDSVGALTVAIPK